MHEGNICGSQVVTSCRHEVDPPLFHGDRLSGIHGYATPRRTDLNPNCVSGINHIDEMTVDDFMVDEPCLKNQTLTVRMFLSAGDMS